uniref:Ig-like domain-containing protein n=1 Tax=Lates calcarifer TaxID=8187 RepID=A0A4W6D5H2_LATCA
HCHFYSLFTAVFQSHGCISVSESQTVEVQSGEEATLLCSNFTTSPSQIIWFRLTNRTQPRCISSIYTATDPASLCSGVQEGKYEMRSNISTVFLKMKDVDSSDSGLYFCGYYISRHPVIVSATYLKVQGKNSNWGCFYFQSDDLNYATLLFRPTANSIRTPASESRVDPDAISAAT